MCHRGTVAVPQAACMHSFAFAAEAKHNKASTYQYHHNASDAALNAAKCNELNLKDGT